MTKVSRSDIFARSEHGGEWFNEFLHSFAKTRQESVQEILSAINDKKAETVESVVQQYREQVGLDSLAAEDSVVKTAATLRKISIRHADEGTSALEMVKKDPKLMGAIDSFCEHSGGTKNTISILNYLRNILGNDVVNYSDEDLKEFIDGRKKRFKVDDNEDYNIDVGLVGQDIDEDADEIADYQTHDGVKK